jgi:hypothetical protein
MQLLGDLDVLSFVRTNRLNWIGQVNRMDSKIKESQVFINNPRGSQIRGRPNNRWRNCMKYTLTDTKLETGKRDLKQSWLEEVHWRGEGPHWTVVPSKKKENKNKKKIRTTLNMWRRKKELSNTQHLFLKNVIATTCFGLYRAIFCIKQKVQPEKGLMQAETCSCLVAL